MSDAATEQEVGREVVISVAGLVRALSLYDTNNVAIQRLVDQLLTAHQKAGSGELRVQLLRDEFFVNGRLLRLDAQLHERAAVLSVTLGRLGVGEVVLGIGLGREHLESFATALSTALRGNQPLASREFGPVALGEARGQGIAAYRFEPERLAVAAYSGLLDLTDRLYAEHAADRAPSLLPLRRSLQLVAEGMEEHPELYLLLAAIHDPAVPLEPTRARVAGSVLAMGFGLAEALGHDTVMTLGLSGLFVGLAEQGDADSAVEPLFRFPGLGDTALPLALTLHDARALRFGQPAQLSGQIVSIAAAYVEGTAVKRPSAAPAQVVRALGAGQSRFLDRELSRQFAAWLAVFPVGSLVALGDGRVAVVLRAGEGPEGGLRPVVQVLGPGGEPGECVDLSKAPGLEIRGTPTYEAAGVDLTRW